MCIRDSNLKNVRIYIVEVGRKLCLPAQRYRQFQFQIHQTAIFKGYSDQKTGTACLNFFNVVTVGRQKIPYIANLHCPYTYSRIHKQCTLYTKPKLQLKIETKAMVKVKPGPSG